MNPDLSPFNSIESLDDFTSFGLHRLTTTSPPLFPRRQVMSTKIVPGDLDIILGRDKEAFNHVGNHRYRVIIDNYGKLYQSQENRDAKTRMTGEIIKSIRSAGSRFLQKNKDTGLYEEVGDVHEKVSHALRSSNKSKKKSSSSTTGARKSRSKLPTQQENRAFGFLYHEQQKVLQELITREGENDRQW